MAVDMKAEDLYDTSKVKQALDMKVNADSIKRQETYSGVTSSTGIYSVVFPQAFPNVPNLQVQLVNATANHTFKAVVTTTGFTVTVTLRAVATIGALEVLLAANNPAGGIAVDVLVTAK